MKFPTKLVCFDPCPGDPYRPVATPIYQTATFEQESAVAFGQYDYSRSGNPTRTVLEKQIARLENGKRAFCFASGLAAITAATRLLSAGDEIVAADDLYGGAYRLLSKILVRTGITVRYVRADDLDGFRKAMGARTRMIYIETPTNPMMRIIDIAALAKIAHENDAILAVDNSLMSPYFQTPLDLGADVALHSATKFLCGHSDVTAGAVVVNDTKIGDQIYLIQNGEGSALAPFDTYLLLRGLMTLSLRQDKQQANAQKVAEFLAKHPAIENVYYAGLPGHPGRELHFRQARGAGSILSFTTDSLETSRKIVESVRLFGITVSFGSINSSISIPHCMSHASIPPEVRENNSVTPNLVRMSVGIEDTDDLIADLQAALALAGENRASVKEAQATR